MNTSNDPKLSKLCEGMVHNITILHLLPTPPHTKTHTQPTLSRKLLEGGLRLAAVFTHKFLMELLEPLKHWLQRVNWGQNSCSVEEDKMNSRLTQ